MCKDIRLQEHKEQDLALSLHIHKTNFGIDF